MCRWSHCASLPVPNSQGKFIASEQGLAPFPAPLPSHLLAPATKQWSHLKKMYSLGA